MKEMNRQMIIGLVLVMALLTQASAIQLPVIDLNNINQYFSLNCEEGTPSQSQQQHQNQNQQQSQSISIAIPQDSNGILISNRGQDLIQPTAILDIGTVTQSRYMPKGEVLVYDISPGATVSVKAASDVGFYSIGFQPDDANKVAGKDATPVYDITFHRMEWGVVTPVDYIDYWTMAATLPTSTDAYMVVVDNRAPDAKNTHIDISGVIRLHSSPLMKEHKAKM
jgi:hypothetical protein